MSDATRVEQIFTAAAEIDSPQERTAYLDEACADDTELRAAVENLLRLDQDAGSFLEKRPEELLADDATDPARGADRTGPPTGTGATVLTGNEVDPDEGWRELLSPSDNPERIGRLGQYEVIELVGRGGMGVVLRAFDPKLNRIVATKLLAPELAAQATAVQRFLREARAAAAVSHDHVVSIYAIDDDARPPMIAMEMIDGQSLQQKIDSTGALDVKSILRIGMQTAAGLSAAHRQGLVHRDIKPANILLENGIEKVKLTDFGLARAVDDIGMTKTGQITGTPQYMSPEQAQGQRVDHRTDLFSLGCVLYAMCTGRAAFRADSAVAVLHRIVHDTPRPIREVNEDAPDWLCAIVDRLLAKNPEERFESALEVEQLLEQYLAHLQQPGSVPMPEHAGLVTSPQRELTSTGNAVEGRKPQRKRAVWPMLILTTVWGVAAVWAIFDGVDEATRFITLAVGLVGLPLLYVGLGSTAILRRDPTGSTEDSPPVATRAAFVLFAGVYLMAAVDGSDLVQGRVAQALGGVVFFAATCFTLLWACLAGPRLLKRRPAAIDRAKSLRTARFFGTLLLMTGVFTSLWCGTSPIRQWSQLSGYLGHVMSGRADVAPWHDVPYEASVRDGLVTFSFDEVTLIFEGSFAHKSSAAHGTFSARGGRSLSLRMVGREMLTRSEPGLPGINTVAINDYTFHLAENCSQLVLPNPDGSQKTLYLNNIARPLTVTVAEDGSHQLNQTSDGSVTHEVEQPQSETVELSENRVNEGVREPFVKLADTWGEPGVEQPVSSIDIASSGRFVVIGRRTTGPVAGVWVLDIAGSFETGGESQIGIVDMPTGVSVTQVAVSPDDRFIAWSRTDGKVGRQFSDFSDLEVDSFLPVDDTLFCLAWSPNGNRIVTGGKGKLYFWDATADWKNSEKADPIQVIDAHDGKDVRTVAWSPDGKWITTGSSDGKVWWWDMTAENPTGEFRNDTVQQPHAVTSMTWAPDSSRVACVTTDGNRHVLSADGLRAASRGVNERPCLAVAWAPNGVRLADSGSNWNDRSRPFILIDYDQLVVREERQQEPLPVVLGEDDGGHMKAITALKFTPEGRYLVSGSEDGTVKWWEFAEPLAARNESNAPNGEATRELIKSLLPEAAGIPNHELLQLASNPKGPDLDDVTGRPLSIMLLLADPSQAPEATREQAADEFRYLTELKPKPADIVRAASLHQERGYATFLQPEYIKNVTVNVTQNSANGIVTFEAPDLFAGKVHYVARKKNGKWRIEEFHMPAYAARIHRDDQGVWQNLRRVVEDDSK